MEYTILHNALARAKRHGLAFNIDLSDIVIPVVCPVLGIPLVRGIGKIHYGSPSLDRVRPRLGYVKGNVRVISHRANTLKRDSTLAEMEKVVADLRQIEAPTFDLTLIRGDSCDEPKCN